MSMFENNNYDHGEDYQRYQDWKIYEKQLAKELEVYDHEMDLLRQQEEDERQGAEYQNEVESAYHRGDFGMGPISRWKRIPWVPAEDYDYDYEAEVKELTTGQRVVQEAQATSREDDEEDMRQLAQVSVNGVYHCELEWLPRTNEVRVEMDSYRNGDPLYYWYPDSMTTSSTLASLLGIPEAKFRITGLAFFTGNECLAALNYETRQFMRSEWKDYAEESVAMQFNVEIIEDETCEKFAQVLVDGEYRWELFWLPESGIIKVKDSEGRPYSTNFTDQTNTAEVLSHLLGVTYNDVIIKQLKFYYRNTTREARDYELSGFNDSFWIEYAKEGCSLSIDVTINPNSLASTRCQNQCYDAACNGTNCEFKLRPHGIDGTQCDCIECDPLFPDPPQGYPEQRASPSESEPESPKPTLLIEEPVLGEPLHIISEQSPNDDKELQLLITLLVTLVAAFIAAIVSTL